MDYPHCMRIDTMKATLGGAWVIALGALALSDLVTSTSSRALVVGCGLVPVAMIWTFWTPPQASLSESIARARE
jgi:hypothetical protein